MNKYFYLWVLGFVLSIFVQILPANVHAQVGVGARIDQPFYKFQSESKSSCTRSGCDETHITTYDQKTGASTMNNFISGIINSVPGVILLRPSLDRSSHSVQKNEFHEKANTDWSVVTDDHEYTGYLLKPSKVKRTITRSGPYGTVTDKIQTSEQPEINERFAKGSGSYSYTSESGFLVSGKQSEDSRAILMLTFPAAVTLDNGFLSSVCPADIFQACTSLAAGVLLPGSNFIPYGGVIQPISSGLSDVIFQDNPTFLVPLKVNAAKVVYDGVGWSNGGNIACTSIKVAGQKLDANCEVTIKVKKKKLIKDVTPSVSGEKYFTYGITINGPITETRNAKKNLTQSASLIQSLPTLPVDYEEGDVTLNRNGFIVGIGMEDLPGFDTLFDSNGNIVGDTPAIQTVNLNSSTYQVGGTANISWTGVSLNRVDNLIDIDLYDYKGLNKISNIVTGLRGGSSYLWVIPSSIDTINDNIYTVKISLHSNTDAKVVSSKISSKITINSTLINPPANIPPTVKIISSPGVQTVRYWAHLIVRATDDNGVSGVQLRVDGLNVGPEVTAGINGLYKFNWDTLSVPNGEHTITAVARDNTGLRTVSEPVIFNVSNATTPANVGSSQTSSIWDIVKRLFGF